MSPVPAPNVQAFFHAYRTAFERFDARRIASHFAYPSHVTSDAGEIVLTAVATEDEWIGKIEELLSTYRRIGVCSARVLDLAATALSPQLYQAVLRWALYDSAGKMLYRFEAAYTLAETRGSLRVTALAHNELPRLRDCLARQRSRG